MSRISIRSIFAASLLAGTLLAGALSAADESRPGYAVENGDVNGDLSRDLSDGIYLLDYLFLGGSPPVPLADCGLERPAVQNGDANGDGTRDLSDGVAIFSWLFTAGRTPVDGCGADRSGGGQACRPMVAPPNARTYGHSLAEWLTIYWRWYYGTNSDPAQGTVGSVRLLPIPPGEVVGGSFTPEDPLIVKGRIEVTIPAGTPFVTPLFAWTRETYEPSLGIPDDPAIPDDDILAGVSPNLAIDGCPVISDANEARYYLPSMLVDPPIVYPEPTSYGSIATIAFQGVGIVALPLPVGVHTMTLYEPYIIANPPPGISRFGIVYDNTWIITVTPH